MKRCIKCDRNDVSFRGNRNVCKICNRIKDKLYKRTLYKERKEEFKNYQKTHRENPEIREQQRLKDLLRSKDPKRIEQQKLWREKNKWRLCANTQLRKARKLQRTPKWLNEEHMKQIDNFYKNRPQGYEVDHIVPFLAVDPITMESIASGLHVPWNLQYLTKLDNIKKKNKYDAINSIIGKISQEN